MCLKFENKKDRQKEKETRFYTYYKNTKWGRILQTCPHNLARHTYQDLFQHKYRSPQTEQGSHMALQKKKQKNIHVRVNTSIIIEYF